MKSLLTRITAAALRLRLVRAFLQYSSMHGSNLADSVTYRALFSVFAGLLLTFSIAALWLGSNSEAMGALVEALNSVIPGITEIVDPSTIAAPTSFTIVGLLSLAGLVGAAISAITSLRNAIRTLAGELHDDGFFLWVYLRNLLVALGFGGLLAGAAALTILNNLGAAALSGLLGQGPGTIGDLATRILGVLLVFVVDTVAIALIFRLLSNVRAPRRALWTGAMLGGAGLTVLQELSSLFVRGATSNPLLVSFAALIALLIWFNLSAQVILLACTYIIVATNESKDRVRERYGASTMAQYRRVQAEDHLRAATQELRAARNAEGREAERLGTRLPESDQAKIEDQ